MNRVRRCCPLSHLKKVHNKLLAQEKSNWCKQGGTLDLVDILKYLY